MAQEPEITINGARLSDAQAMTLRVALTTFNSEMGNPNALGPDAAGRGLVSAYRRNSADILGLMLGKAPA